MEGVESIVELGVLILLGVMPFALWLWSLIHCVTNRRLSDPNRLIGVLPIVFLFLIGGFVYLFLPRSTAGSVSTPHA